MSYRSELIQVAAVAVAAIQNLDAGSTAIETSYELDKSCAIASEVLGERERQEKKWGPQRHHPEKWMVILMEEVGEAAEAVLEDNLK